MRLPVVRVVALVAAGEAMTSPLDPDQRLVVCPVEPDSPTARVLPMLAGWGAEVRR